MDNRVVTMTLEISGFVVVENLGVARGSIVRSRSIVGNFLGGYSVIIWRQHHHLHRALRTSACRGIRADGLHTRQRQADAIIGMRYDATEIMAGLTEVLCYGTAVKLKATVK